eukprot:TRINITY_DN7939_c0_g1_i10.p1 TRINITY_DN7939_c0_g1~~TRINITY_DN7939_c0_g1_i10.p1  ORF type:complete len:346 (+),score=60.65 TRINITY_DN7939_c0_g1_i10:161-1198(+)
MDCPKCHSHYQKETNIPLLLIKCGHTLCNTCATALFSGASITCPECNCESSVSAVSALPKNMALLSISPQAKLKAANLKVDAEAVVSCNAHRKKVEAFCFDDLALLCIDCILVDGHKAHDISSIPQAYDKERERLEKSFEAASKLETTLLTNLENLEAFKHELHLKADEKRDAITSIFREIISTINERENFLKQNIANILEKEESNLHKLEKSIQDHLDHIKSFKESIVDMQSESSCKLLSKAKARKELIAKANAAAPSVSLNVSFGEVKRENELGVLWKMLCPSTVSKQGSKFHNGTASYNNKKTDKVSTFINHRLPRDTGRQIRRRAVAWHHQRRNRGQVKRQ